MFKHRFNKELDLENPLTLNEKIQWLKLNAYSNNPLVTQCADKYRVREYLRERGCNDILNELYGAWDRVEDIPWDSLPDSFVLKCNHGCGYNILCPNKGQLDIPQCRKQLKAWMKEDFWRVNTELQYKGIPKKIICERYLGGTTGIPVDYKVYCFNGKPMYILVCENRDKFAAKFYFFDTRWEFYPYTRDGLKESEDFTLKKPESLEQMLEYARKLSEPFDYVRVDFFEVDGKLYFGELTFTPAAGMDTGRLPRTDVSFGEILKLTQKTD